MTTPKPQAKTNDHAANKERSAEDVEHVAADKKAKKKAASPARANSALAKPVKISEQLAPIVGDGPLPRTEVTKRVWDYIRKHELQNPENKREIVADERLKDIFGKDKVTMFEMTKLVSKHLS